MPALCQNRPTYLLCPKQCSHIVCNPREGKSRSSCTSPCYFKNFSIHLSTHTHTHPLTGSSVGSGRSRYSHFANSRGRSTRSPPASPGGVGHGRCVHRQCCDRVNHDRCDNRLSHPPHQPRQRSHTSCS